MRSKQASLRKLMNKRGKLGGIKQDKFNYNKLIGILERIL
jgi:hypothetical protein